MIKRKETSASLGIGINESIPEGIFGINKVKLIRADQRNKQENLPVKTNKKKIKTNKKKIKTNKKKIKTSNRKNKDTLPLVYNTLPEEAKNLEISNLIKIPEEELKLITRIIGRKANKLQRLLLTEVIPIYLSFEGASNYCKTAMLDGLGVDLDIDRSCLEIVNNIVTLKIVHHYLCNITFPVKYKQRFYNKFIDELAKSSVTKFDNKAKSDNVSKSIKELHGIVVKRLSEAGIPMQGRNVNRKVEEIKKSRREVL
jgi:hypothetical protein